jgi:hypothetical protein
MRRKNMPEKKIAYEMKPGEEFESFEFSVSPELNQAYLDSLEANHRRYQYETESGPPIVHPGLLINFSNVTRSPSWYLPEGVAGVNSKDEVEYINPARVGKKFRVYWKVTDAFTKRGKRFFIKKTLIVDEGGLEILRRRGVDAFVSKR